jgi:hypothetical protein
LVGKEVDVLNGFVGAVVGVLEFGGWAVADVGVAMKVAVGERPAKEFVEEQEEQRHLEAFGGEAIGVARSITLRQQAVVLEPTRS